MSPEIALCVFLKLLPVQSVLVRPHPDFNLRRELIRSIFTLLSVCMLARRHRSRRGCASVWRESFPGRIVFAFNKATLIRQRYKCAASSFPEQSNTPSMCSVFCTYCAALLPEDWDSCKIFSTANICELQSCPDWLVTIKACPYIL